MPLSRGVSFKVSTAGARNNISSGWGRRVRSSRTQTRRKQHSDRFGVFPHVFWFDSENERGDGWDGGSELHTRPLAPRCTRGPRQRARKHADISLGARRPGGACTPAELLPDCPKWFLSYHKIPEWGDGGLVWGWRATPMWWGGWGLRKVAIKGKLQLVLGEAV